MKNKELKYSLIYLSTSLMAVLLSFFSKDHLNADYYAYALSFFVVFFGLPHGALDTLVAKKNNLLKTFNNYIYFYAIYMFIGLMFFFFWFYFPTIALFIFLLISIFHFSEDWKMDLKTHERITIAIMLVSCPIFFHSTDINSIFLTLTETKSINFIIFFFENIFYFSLFYLTLIFFFNLKKKHILLNIITILFTAITLNPLLFFICYFCFFHSIKNYKDTVDSMIKLGKKTIYKIIIMNIFLTLILSYFAFNFFLTNSVSEKLIKVAFIGLASLTVPHMLLKTYIDYKIN